MSIPTITANRSLFGEFEMKKVVYCLCGLLCDVTTCTIQQSYFQIDMTDWSFLYPWRDALCSVLTPQESLSSRVLARMTNCRHDGNPRSMITCMLVVNFPADERLRKNQMLLQTVREAIEIFNVLVAVDKTAFVELLPEFTDVVREIWDISDGPRLIRLVWDCTLVGQLSPSDPVASKPSVTWGELFGCPDDPWEYSERFRDTMNMLEVKGLEDIGDQWGVLESIEYSAKDDGVPVNGDQWIEKGLAGDAATGISSFCQGLGNLFKLDAALPAHVCGVQDGSRLVELWRNRPGWMDTPSSGDAIDIFWPTFLSNMEQITAPLVYTAMTSLTMRFGGNGISDSGVATANAGFFFSTIFCGRPFCTREGMNDDFPILQQRTVYKKLSLEYNSSSELAGCCSAIPGLQQVGKLKFSMNSLEWADKWKWLIYALFSSVSNIFVQKLSISSITLTEADVDDIEAVLKSNYPLPILYRGSSNLAQSPQYGYVHLVKGTKLRPVIMDTTDDIIVVLCDDFRSRAMFDPIDIEDNVHVVIPGYGICQVSVGDGANEFMSDNSSDPETLTVPAHRIPSLELDLEEIEDGNLIPRLLNPIGKHLQYLSVRYAGETYQNIDLGDIATVCPVLERLFLRDFNASITTSNVLLRAWGIKSLILEGSNEIAGLPDCLSDPTFRMSRELTELRILPPPTRFQPSWMRDLNVSAEFVTALQEHDGEILPTTRQKLSVASKIAILSVVEARDVQGLSVGSSNCMDFHVLTSIFAFAAIPEQRVVEAIAYGGLPRPRLRQH